MYEIVEEKIEHNMWEKSFVSIPGMENLKISFFSVLSERNSEASLDLASLISFSSNDDDCDVDDDDEEDRFRSLEEGQQKDLEHTEYSVLPLRRPSKGHELEEKVYSASHF